MTAPPLRIDDTVADGFVSPGFRRGSLFVKNTEGQLIRLAWETVKGEEANKSQGKTARWRALPPGTYTLTGYRILRKDEAGTEWFVSAIAPKGIRKFTVRSGRPQKIGVNPAITFGAKGVAKQGFMIQSPIQGRHHAGLSIYKEGKRIPMRYSVTDPDGKELEAGKMNYG